MRVYFRLYLSVELSFCRFMSRKMCARMAFVDLLLNARLSTCNNSNGLIEVDDAFKSIWKLIVENMQIQCCVLKISI